MLLYCGIFSFEEPSAMPNEVFFQSNKTSIMLEGLLRQCESFDQFEEMCSDDMLNSDCRISIYLMRLLDKYG